MTNVVAKGMNGRPKTVERATEIVCLLCELAAADVVVEYLLKGTTHKVPKLVLACTEALRVTIASFGTPKVLPPKPVLKGISHLFDSKDAKIRGAAKDLTVELTRWLGPDAVKRDLLDKMRDTMQAEVREMIGENPPGLPRATRLTRAEQADPPPEPMDIDGEEETVGANLDTSGGPATGAPGAEGAIPDAYEYADPEVIFDKLEKTPADKEQPKFWIAIVSAKWKERLGALSQLRELADCPRLAAGDYGDIGRALKKVVTKDANIACVGEACVAAGNLAKGARKEWSREGRMMLPGMLDKFKDKNASVVQKIHDALAQVVRHCFTLGDVSDDVVAALGHKVPKVAEQTLLWVARSIEEMKGGKSAVMALHKTMLPAVVKCVDAKTPEVRAAALEAISSIARASGGYKSVAKSIDSLDDAMKRKIEDMCGGCAAVGTVPLAARDPNAAGSRAVPAKPASTAAVRSSITGALIRPGSTGASTARSARTTRPGTSHGASTARGGVTRTSTSSKPAGSGGTVSSTSVDDASVTEGAGVSEGELAERLAAMFSSDVVEQLRSGEWKQRLAGIEVVADAIAATPAEELDRGAVDTVVRGLAVYPGFAEKNFQVSTKVFQVFNALATKSEAFTKRDGAQCVSGMADKVADVKLRGPACEALTAMAEALGPKFVMAQLHKHTATHKNPKVTAEALLWCAGAVHDFGSVHVDTAFTIEWCKQALALANPAPKSAAGKVLGAIHGALGPGVKDFLSDLKDAQLKTLEAEFARNPFGQNAGMVARKVRAIEGGTVDKAVTGGGGLPRTDISSKITPKLIKDMSDPSWKIRAAAVETVGAILTEANRRIAPQTGELMGALAQRFSDSNRNLATSALKIAGEVAEAMGSAVGERRHGLGVVSEVAKQMGDSKSTVRAATVGALDAFTAAAGLGKTLPLVSDKLVDLNPKMSTDGKADALSWMFAALTGPMGDDGTAGTLDLAPCVAAAAVGLSDRGAAARAAGGRLMDEVIRRMGSHAALKLCSTTAAPALLKKAATAHVEKSGAVIGSVGSAGPSPATSPAKARNLNPAAGMQRGGSGAMTARGIARSSVSASRSGALTARGAVGASVSGSLSASAAAGPVLLLNEEKEARLKKQPKKPVKFEVLRDDQLKLAEDDLKMALAPYVRADVHELLFKDFKAHIQALEYLTEGALHNTPDVVPGNLDLLLRWVVLRFCEQAPNTQSLLKVLDFTAATLAAVKDQGTRLSEQECALFLPALVDKCGHSMEAVRDKFRKILRTIPGLFPASRLVGYLVRGLDSKNTKTRLEILDALGSLMERHGLDVVERGGVKALAEVAKLADVRDMHMRTAALTCLTTAYKVGGDDVKRHIGRVSHLVESALEEKFAKAAKEMERKKEGQPGAWIKGGSLVGGGSTAAATAVGAVPVPTGLAGRSVSRSVAAPGRLGAMGAMTSSLQAARASKPLDGLRAAAAAHTVTAPAPQRTTTQAWAPEPPPAAPAQVVEQREPLSMEVRLANWKRSLVAVGSVSDAVAVEGMKAVCHEVMAAVADPAIIKAMASDTDHLVGMLADRVVPIFDAAAAAPGPSTTRACKYVLNTLMQVYQEPTLAAAVGETNEQETVAVLLHRLLDPAVPLMEEGPQLVKALNVLMLKVLEHCPRTSSFRALLRLLARAPAPLAEDPAMTVKFHDLVVKCLIKLTKALGATLHIVHLPTLLADVHDFFHSLGVDEIRRRGQADDKPLRMVKTILHEVTKLVGHDIYDSLTECPPRDADPAPIIYAYVDLNLKSMPDAPGVPRPSSPPPAAPAARETGHTPGQPTATPTPKASTLKMAAVDVAVEGVQPTDAPTGSSVTTPPKTSPAPAKTSPPWAAPRAQQVTSPGREAGVTTTPQRGASVAPDGIQTRDVTVTPDNAEAKPATPVSAELKTELAGIFKMIGEKATTADGLERLYDFSNAHPSVDIQPHLARTSSAFQNYIKRGLAKVGAARAAQGEAGAAGAQPAIAPSPMPHMEKSAAELYRERLARMQSAKGAAASGAVAANGTGKTGAASVGLTTLRERMDRIAAKAAGTGAGGVVTGGGASGPSTVKIHVDQIEDLQARMERIKAGRSEA